MVPLGKELRTFKIGRRIVPLWLVAVILVSGICSGAAGYYLWKTLNIPLEVKEPIDILYYPTDLSLYPGENMTFYVTVVNHASVNYSVLLDFKLSNTTYQTDYVTFSNIIYTVLPIEQNLTAWMAIEPDAPPINTTLDIGFKREAETELTWWDSDWQYRKQVNITEISGYSLTDFPVEITFRHDGHVQVDGRDIRVVDNSSEISYCLTQVNSTWASIVCEVNATASLNKIIHVYYGNPTAQLPDYPLTPLAIVQGNSGHAMIDNRVYVGWDYTSWGWSNNVELWNDFRIDFNGNGDPTDDSDLIRNFGSRQGGIGRHRADVQAIGLGDYMNYVQTPIYVDINFANAALRVYRNHPWVETTQADYMHMFSPSYTHMCYRGGADQNMIDGQGINTPEGFGTSYTFRESPGWMAFRDNASGYVFASTGSNIGSDYAYEIGGKEASDWDRNLNYNNRTRYEPALPYDQPSECRIYWYGDNSNGYSEIGRIAAILDNPPIASISTEETR